MPDATARAATPLSLALSRGKVVAAFAAIYTIWGSTYLAIHLAVETIPAFLMMAARCLVAGAVLYGLAAARGDGRASWAEWRGTAMVGTMFFVGCHGVLAFAMRGMASGLAALLFATIPLWTVLLGWASPGGRRPGLRAALGIVVGFAGVAVLIAATRGVLPGALDPFYVAVTLFSAFSWAAGSVVSRGVAIPSSPVKAAGMELLAGGIVLLGISAATGELGELAFASVSLRSLLGLLYLIVFGSLLSFSAYVWLLDVSTPQRVATYAYVNPVVAVFLGWLILGETVTGMTLFAAAMIIAAVAAIIGERPAKDRARPRRRTA